VTDRWLSILEEAQGELRAAASWYEREQPGLGVRFVDEVEATFHMIETYPMSGELLEEPVRYFPVGAFPYNVYYAADADRFQVVGIAHVARAPEVITAIKRR
jgi:plasmid stabilization system protein ParE